MSNADLPARLADLTSGEWTEHPRFHGIWLKSLLTSADNALASVNTVRVPPGGVIGRHRHPAQVETVFVLAGQSLLTLGDADVLFRAGQLVAIPVGLEHGLRNEGKETVELLTIFTPPLAFLTYPQPPPSPEPQSRLRRGRGLRG